MNLFFPILCVAAAGIAGYALEPSMRESLTGKPAAPAKSIVTAEPGAPAAPPVAPSPAPVAPTPPPVEPPPAATEEPATPPPVAAIEPEVPMKEADPAPAPGSSKTLSAEEIVKVMQDSVRSSQVKEFTFDQVLGWKAGEEEEVDGEKYQTGVAAYKAETIFGVKTIQAKALLKGGAVAKWIWPNSGMEIK